MTIIRNHITIYDQEPYDNNKNGKKGSFISYVPKIFRKNDVHVRIGGKRCLLRDVCFLESFTYVLNERSQNERLFVDRAIHRINSFLDTVSILHSLKTPENLKFSGVNREYKIRILAGNGLNISFIKEFLKKHFLKN